jgi:hypothetical protein
MVEGSAPDGHRLIVVSRWHRLVVQDPPRRPHRRWWSGPLDALRALQQEIEADRRRCCDTRARSSACTPMKAR